MLLWLLGFAIAARTVWWLVWRGYACLAGPLHEKSTAKAFGGLAALTLLIWLLAGTSPLLFFRSSSDAAAFAKSFGFVNSFFSSFGLAFVALTLYLQIRELSEAGKTQGEQARMLERQMKIAERTAEIQNQLRLDGKRTAGDGRIFEDREGPRSVPPGIFVLAPGRPAR